MHLQLDLLMVRRHLLPIPVPVGAERQDRRDQLVPTELFSKKEDLVAIDRRYQADD